METVQSKKKLHVRYVWITGDKDSKRGNPDMTE